VLSGFQRPNSGHVLINDEDITKLSPHRRVRRGLTRTFQSVRLFKGLTVLENVEAAALAIGLRRQDAQQSALEALRQVGLESHADAIADALPYGYERRIGIARAIVTKPRFLLLDEPAAGLNESE